MNIPGFATAGDTITWVDEVASDLQGNWYTPGQYSLAYSLRGPAALDVQAVDTNGAWQTTITPQQSATLLAGPYYWMAYVEDADGNRFTVGNGQIIIQVDLSRQTGAYDGRTTAKKIIDAIDAEILARTSGGSTVEYSIAGRSLRKETLEALQMIRADWVAIYAKEVRAQRIAQGLGDPTARFAMFRPNMPRVPGGWNW